MEGVGKASGKPYKFYTGKLVTELGVFDFSSSENFAVGLDFKSKSAKLQQVKFEIADGKAKISSLK
jgi:hypothetical protein